MTLYHKLKPRENLPTLARKLRAYMVENEITVKALAEAAELTVSQISRYASGKATPDVATLKKIAYVLGQTVDYFVND